VTTGKGSRTDKVGWLLSAPALTLLTIGAAGPLLIVMVYAFLEPGEYSGVIWNFTTEAWFRVLFERDIFTDEVSLADAHLTIFWRSVKLSLLTTLATFVIGFPTAWFIATRPREERALWLFLITIPFWTNLLIRTFAILEVIRNQGLLNSALMGLGVIDAPIQILYTDTAVLIGMAYVYLPLMVLPLYAAIDRFDFKLIEAAYDLYASRWLVLRKIILPLGPARRDRGVDPGLRAVPRRLCDAPDPGRGQEHDDRQLHRVAVRAGPELAARRGAGLDPARHRRWRLAGLCPRFVEGRRPMARRGFSITAAAGVHDHRRDPFILLYAPIVTMVVYSFNAGESVALWGGFSLKWYAIAWENEQVQEATIRSLVIATFAAGIATTVATMAALGTTRRGRFKGADLHLRMINQPLMVPEIVTAVALLIFFAAIKVATGYTGLIYLIVAHAAFCVPFAYLPIRARLEGMDTDAGDGGGGSLRDAVADLPRITCRFWRRGSSRARCWPS
jgi:spermidine/putrescine transport system permease protein